MTPNPILISIGPISIRWYGVLIAGGFLLGAFLALREARRQGWNPDHFLNVLLVVMPSALVGARLYYVLFNLSYYQRHLAEIPATWLGGLAFHGGLFGALAASWFMLRHYRMNYAVALDIGAPSIVLGQAIGRWGNFFNQEAYGYAVDKAAVPWAMMIDGAWRHPAFLYESLWDLAVFAFLLYFRRREWALKGDVFLAYGVLYSAGRFWIEGLRTDSLMFLGMRTAQMVSLLMILVCGGIFVYRRRRAQKKSTDESMDE
ncbi:MAG: prolipoprotein diacylglyceryl transferase [Peptococcaceae bacterium]|nr:prolipoprotein diacylglyceryl transferase [Peptococcaceae bacterium]